ncbi:TonB-dependent receptor [Rhodanobacter koreensis]
MKTLATGKKRVILALALGVGALADPLAIVHAQSNGSESAKAPDSATTSAASKPKDSDAVQLQGVTVTATRREQLLQVVPVSVTAISGKELASSNFQDASDIQYLAPNVTFSASQPVSHGGGYQIRGIGTQTYDSGVEQSVGLVVDDVVIGLPRDPGVSGFNDVERVEVLRGPQGTLFGKNASAGVIQIVTNNPDIGKTSANLNLSYGERGEQIANGNLNIPIGSTSALRLSAFYQSQDGNIPYVVLHGDGDIGDRDSKGFRAKYLWLPNDNLSVLVTAEHQSAYIRDGFTIQSLGIDPMYDSTFNGFAVKPGPNVFASYQDRDSFSNTSINGASAKLDYSLGDYTITSISAFRQMKLTQQADGDLSPVDILDINDGGIRGNQLTQELRLTSPSDQKLEYVAGAYFYHTDISGSILQMGNYYGLLGGIPLVVGGGNRIQHDKTDSYAGFGQATYALTDKWKLIGGLRYTSDLVEGDLHVIPVAGFPYGTAVPYMGNTNGTNVSGKLGVQYTPNESAMLYGTISTGYKGPALDGTTGTLRSVKPESVQSYEFGIKSTLLDDRMTLDAAVYRSDFKNFQTNALYTGGGTVQFVLANAGLMRSRGVELESTWLLVKGFTIGANAAYNDARFKNYLGACYPGQPLSGVVGVGCYVDPASSSEIANYADVGLPNSPKWTYGLHGSYEHPLGQNLKFDAGAIWSWRSSSFTTPSDPGSVTGAYGLLNANLGIGKSDGTWRVGLYARNLLDKRFYGVYALPTLNTNGYVRYVSPDAFRTVGVNLSLKF